MVILRQDNHTKFAVKNKYQQTLRNCLLIMFTLFLSNTTFASQIVEKIATKTEATTNKTVKVASMVASPNSCALEPTAEFCEMNFHILWQTPHKGDFCLHSKKGVKPLQCWYNTDHGTVALEFFSGILDADKTYTLLDAQGDHLIATVNVPITGTLKQRQRAQRRRRGFWRMF